MPRHVDPTADHVPPPFYPSSAYAAGPYPPPPALTGPALGPTHPNTHGSILASSAAEEPRQRRKHRCAECDKSFTTSGHLARHIKMHTGERAHKCPFPGCETACSRQDNLQQHYRVHLSPLSKRVPSTVTRAAMSRDRAQNAEAVADTTATQANKRRRRSKRELPVVPLSVPASSPAPAPFQSSAPASVSPSPPPSPPLTPPPLEQAPLDVLMGLRAPRVLPGQTHIPVPILRTAHSPEPSPPNVYPPSPRGDRGYGLPVEMSASRPPPSGGHQVGAVSYQQAAATSAQRPSEAVPEHRTRLSEADSASAVNGSPVTGLHDVAWSSDAPVCFSQPSTSEDRRARTPSDPESNSRSHSPPEHYGYPQTSSFPPYLPRAADTDASPPTSGRVPPPMSIAELTGYGPDRNPPSAPDAAWTQMRALPPPRLAIPSMESYPISQGPFRGASSYAYPHTPVSSSEGSSRYASPSFDKYHPPAPDAAPTPRYHSPLPGLSAMVGQPLDGRYAYPPMSSHPDQSYPPRAPYPAATSASYRRGSPVPVLPPIHELTADRWSPLPPIHAHHPFPALREPQGGIAYAPAPIPHRREPMLYPPRPTPGSVYGRR